MKELTGKFIIDEKLLKICRNKTLEVTCIDVFKKNKYRTQTVVDARISFIGCLNSITTEKDFSSNAETIGNYIHVDRSTVFVHRRNIVIKNGISKEVLEDIEEITKLVSIEIFDSSAINNNVIESIKNKLMDYIIYLNKELEKTSKLLQTIKE
jgi:hypothetical protein